MNISIIIPNYNGADLLRRNLPKVIGTLRGYKKGSVEVIISDDHSDDDSEAAVLQYQKKFTGVSLRFITGERNSGFSTNVNRGVSKASGDIIVLLNTDVIPEKHFLEKLIPHFSDSRVFAVGFMDKSIEGDKTILRGRGVGSWNRWIVTHERGGVTKHDSFWASGGSSAFRKSYWNELGGFYEVYNPFYWEDVDLSYRALKAGYTIRFDPDIIMRHEHETGAIRSSYSKADIKKIAYRNQLLFTWLNITDTKLLTVHIIWLVYYTLKALFTGKFFIVSAVYDAVKRIADVRKLRRKMYPKNKVTDRQILTSFAS